MMYLNKPFILITTTTLLTRSIMAISRTNWVFLWIAIEINMLRFIPIIVQSKTNQETEASIKYFIAQALGSRIILISRITQWSTSTLSLNFLLIAAIILKLGMVPFHFWFPSVITSLSWVSCTILATWQKLAPLIILSFLLINRAPIFLLLIASSNALLGGIIGINQSHLRTIIAYSSITHIGWISRILYILKPILTIAYYIMYCAIIIPLFIILNQQSQQNSKQFNKINTISPIMQIIVPIILLSLRGMPPLTGFIPKWITIFTLCESTPLILLIIILGAIINIYFYINILFNSLLSLNIFNKNNSTHIKPKISTILATISLSFLPLFIL